MTLADRVRHLIDTRHGGSVNSAARVLGIPQRTLADVASGKVRNPRADLVRRIAEFHEVTTDWMLSGEGEPPPLDPQMMHFPIEAERKWSALIRDLELPWEAEGAITRGPWAFGDTIGVLPFSYYGNDYEAAAKIRKARYLGYAAWTALLSGLIDLWGKDVVRERLSHPALTAWFKRHYANDFFPDLDALRAMPEDWAEVPRNQRIRKPSRKK